MRAKLKQYRWFGAGIVAVLLALGGAAQAGLISPDIGNQTALTVATALTISNTSPEPAIVRFRDATGHDHTYAFVRMSDNAIWYRTRPDDTNIWGNWQSLGGVLTSAPAATVRWSGTVYVLYLYAKGSDDAIYQRWYDGASWGNWESLGGPFSSGPAVTRTGQGEMLIARGSDNVLWSRTQECTNLGTIYASCTWSGADDWARIP